MGFFFGKSKIKNKLEKNKIKYYFNDHVLKHRAYNPLINLNKIFLKPSHQSIPAQSFFLRLSSCKKFLFLCLSKTTAPPAHPTHKPSLTIIEASIYRSLSQLPAFPLVASLHTIFCY